MPDEEISPDPIAPLRSECAVLPAGLRRAVAYICDHSDHPISLPQIAAAAGVSSRTLQKHFNRFLGTSPIAWLRRVRLEHAHDDFLREADGGKVTVIASSRGFSHLGRFSAAYRDIYRERPSETLRSGHARAAIINRVPQPSVATLLQPGRWQTELTRASRCRPEHPEALALALLALPLASIAEPASAAQALELAGKAHERDPEYALPLALAAWCHAQRVVYTWTACPAAERQTVLRLANEAARRDDGDATVQTALCAAYAAIGDLANAERCIDTALAADPASHWAWQRSAWLQSYHGNAATATAQFRHALQIDPGAPQTFNTYIGLGIAAFDAGNYREATGWIRLGLRSSPSALWSHRILAAAEARQGYKDEARLSAMRLRRSQPDLSIGQIIATLPVNANFLARLADGLETAGLPP